MSEHRNHLGVNVRAVQPRVEAHGLAQLALDEPVELGLAVVLQLDVQLAHALLLDALVRLGHDADGDAR